LIRNPEEPHHHIICLDTGMTEEFESPDVLAIATEIAKQRNLQLVDVQLKLFCVTKKDSE
ncbi:MAG: transcriptional repressor, partial [Vampirovibrio sp.]|nr:transcriptional repressor [Vampirovibrio sp.]